MSQVVDYVGKICVGPVPPSPELGDRLQIVCNRTPRFLRSLKQITRLEFLLSVPEEALSGHYVILDFGLSHG